MATPSTHMHQSSLLKDLDAQVRAIFVSTQPSFGMFGPAQALLVAHVERVRQALLRTDFAAWWGEANAANRYGDLAIKEESFCALALSRLAQRAQDALDNQRTDRLVPALSALRGDAAQAHMASLEQDHAFFLRVEQILRELTAMQRQGALARVSHPKYVGAPETDRGPFTESDGTSFPMHTTDGAVQAAIDGQTPTLFAYDAQTLPGRLRQAGVTDARWIVFGQDAIGRRRRETHRLQGGVPEVAMGWGDRQGEVPLKDAFGSQKPVTEPF